MATIGEQLEQDAAAFAKKFWAKCPGCGGRLIDGGDHSACVHEGRPCPLTDKSKGEWCDKCVARYLSGPVR